MNVDTERMQEYSDYMADCSRQILELCTGVEECLSLALSCMDSSSGAKAARRLTQNIENIRANIKWTDDTCKRLVLAKKQVIDAGNVMGR